MTSTRLRARENWATVLRKARAHLTAIHVVSLSAAARPAFRLPRCISIGIDALIVDRHQRVGDNWRTRYHSLTLAQ